MYLVAGLMVIYAYVGMDFMFLGRIIRFYVESEWNGEQIFRFDV
jgi:hypothetical protein